MKKLSIILTVLLCLALVVSCKQPEPEPEVNMTDYYRSGRQKIIDYGYLALPMLEGLDSTAGVDSLGFWTANSVTFDLDVGVTEAAYNSMKACIEALCGTTQTENHPVISYETDGVTVEQIDNWWEHAGVRYNLCYNIKYGGLYFNILGSGT
ncbi:MAG: hypothetical protein J5785_01670 [Spirochaetales bacterium]|nr:hypothetical protein [Spirochaetales bacterium]